FGTILAVVRGESGTGAPGQPAAVSAKPGAAVRGALRAGGNRGGARQGDGASGVASPPALAESGRFHGVLSSGAPRLPRGVQRPGSAARMAAAVRASPRRPAGGGALRIPLRQDVLLLPIRLRPRLRLLQLGAGDPVS